MPEQPQSKHQGPKNTVKYICYVNYVKIKRYFLNNVDIKVEDDLHLKESHTLPSVQQVKTQHTKSH